MAYAEDTSVPIEKSKAEIERLLARAGSDQFLAGTDSGSGKAFVACRIHGWQIRLSLTLPRFEDPKFLRDGRGSLRSPQKRYEVFEQACRSRWRALALVVKAKLEAVELGIDTLETAFLSDLMLGDGRTVGETAIPDLVRAKEGGSLRLPPLLGAGKGAP